MSENNVTSPDASLTEAWVVLEKLPEMEDWLRELRSEAAQSQYAFLILKKHLTRNGAAIRFEDIPSSWHRFSWLLYLNTDGLLREAEHTLMLRDLWRELVDFCHAIPDDFSTYRLLEILEKFIDKDAPRALILPLLPLKALEKLGAIDQMLDDRHEEYLFRLNQTGY